MPVHGVAFFENVDNGTTAFGGVAALRSELDKVNGDDYYAHNTFNKIMGAYVLSTVTTRARISAPSIKKSALFELAPLDNAAEPPSRPAFIDLRNSPLQLEGGEQVNIQTMNSGAAAVDQWGLLWLCDEVPQPVQASEIIHIRATNTATLTDSAWTNVSLTLDEDLPVGDYDVIGMKAMSAGCIAARAVFEGQVNRPMVIGCDAITDVDEMLFRNGNMGVLGTMRHDTPPTIDFLSLSADNSQVVWLDIVKKG